MPKIFNHLRESLDANAAAVEMKGNEIVAHVGDDSIESTPINKIKDISASLYVIAHTYKF